MRKQYDATHFQIYWSAVIVTFLFKWIIKMENKKLHMTSFLYLNDYWMIIE